MWLSISRDHAAVLCTLICVFVMIRRPLDFQVAFCLVWKQVFMQNYWKSILPRTVLFSCKSKSFLYERFCTKPHFEQRHKVTWKWHLPFWLLMYVSCCQYKASAYHMWSYGPRRLNTALTWDSVLLHLSKTAR